MAEIIIYFERLVAIGIWELTEMVGMVVFFANIITIALPNHSRYKPIQVVLDFLNKLSLNILQNANKLHSDLSRGVTPKTKPKRKKTRLGGSKP